MSKELAALIAKRFIQRRDVKAIQFDRDFKTYHAGDWFPDTRLKPNSPHAPRGFKMQHLLNHIDGKATYGHYLLDADSKCRMFAFDIDLKKEGSYVKLPNFDLMPDFIKNDSSRHEEWVQNQTVVSEGVHQRNIWQSREKMWLEARNWYKYQFRTLAHILASKVEELDIPCAVAYSGSKGVHVYGFTGEMEAAEVRQAALLVLDVCGEFEPLRGNNFWHHKNEDPVTGFRNLEIEVFPKQTTVSEGGLGNLLRLPLGINHKNPRDPTFFVDMTSSLSELKPHPDPVELLSGKSVFA